jgi:hypothetical protein
VLDTKSPKYLEMAQRHISLSLLQTIRAHPSSRSPRCVASSWTRRLVVLLAQSVACSARSPPRAWLPNSPWISPFVRTPPGRNLIPALIYRVAPLPLYRIGSTVTQGTQIEGERKLAAMVVECFHHRRGLSVGSGRLA